MARTFEEILKDLDVQEKTGPQLDLTYAFDYTKRIDLLALRQKLRSFTFGQRIGTVMYAMHEKIAPFPWGFSLILKFYTWRYGLEAGIFRYSSIVLSNKELCPVIDELFEGMMNHMLNGKSLDKDAAGGMSEEQFLGFVDLVRTVYNVTRATNLMSIITELYEALPDDKSIQISK